jgi:O-antigen/teichoic acid export membrane protein
LGESIATFGLDRAITRFIPIYHEKQDYNKLFGTLLMVFGTMLTLGLGMAAALYGFHSMISQYYVKDPLSLDLLMILIFLSPVQSFDDLLVGMFAVFTGSRAIFFRKYVLAPGLRLAVVLLLTLGHSDVYFLAAGYLGAGVIGIIIYSYLLLRAMNSQGLMQHFNRRTLVFPWREVLNFTVPLLTSDLVYAVMNTMDAVMVQYFFNTLSIAGLRAVQPTAKLNQMVLASFALLFTPAAARMFARNDREGINNLYWQNAVWVAVASFPIFVLTFSLAGPITTLLYGERYADSALIMALLSFAYYFNAALGQNGLTLKVAINILVVVANFLANLWLIPRYGALGAAIGTTSTLVLHNILKQAGLRMGTGINLFEWRYFRVYLIITLTAIGLWLIQWLTNAPPYVSVGLAVVGSLLVFRLNRHMLNVKQTFPELLRLPLMNKILGE